MLANPRGGRSQGVRLIDAVRPVLEAAPARVSVRVSEYPGHARELVRDIELGPYDAVIVIGGDGTLHEVVNGMMARRDGSSIPIGLIPGGSGNSFAQDLGDVDAVGAARRIATAGVRRVDLARVDMPGRTVYAANIIGWGLVTDINITAEGMRRFGERRYTLATLARITRLRSRPARLVLDGAPQQDRYVFVIACNSQHTGKGMKMAPRARLDDGLIDLVLVRRASRVQLLKMFPKVFDGTHLSSPVVEYHQLKTFSIEPETDEMLNIDGELTGSTPARVEVLPGAVGILA